MAKSLRSKWKRKMKAHKRERYGEKENVRLINMLTKCGEYPQDGEIKIEEVTELPSTKGAPEARTLSVPERRGRTRKLRGEGRKSRKDRAEEGQIVDEEVESDEDMSVDKPQHIFSKRSMKDQFGNYPAWMNKRKMKTQQKKNKRIAKNRALSVAGKRVRKTN